MVNGRTLELSSDWLGRLSIHRGLVVREVLLPLLLPIVMLSMRWLLWLPGRLLVHGTLSFKVRDMFFSNDTTGTFQPCNRAITFVSEERYEQEFEASRLARKAKKGSAI